jgi:hypothetical protein
LFGAAPVSVDTTAGVDELDVLLTEVGRRGFLLHAFRTDLHGPEIVAFVHGYGGVADVLILFDEQRACAHRVPTGPGIDMFAPHRVHWSYAHTPVWTVRALLTVAPPGHPDAPATLIDTPPGYGLPAQGRLPMRIRHRGWR